MIYYRKLPEGSNKKEQTCFARGLLLEALGEEYGLTALPRIQTGEHGKPYFPDCQEIFFNYSHSGTAIVCGISDCEIGVDIESLRPFRERTARRFCTAEEWNWLQEQPDQDSAWIRIWVIKEAFLKYQGTGLAESPQKYDFSKILKVPEGIAIRYLAMEPESDQECWITTVRRDHSWIAVCGGRGWDGKFFTPTRTRPYTADNTGPSGRSVPRGYPVR